LSFDLCGSVNLYLISVGRPEPQHFGRAGALTLCGSGSDNIVEHGDGKKIAKIKQLICITHSSHICNIGNLNHKNIEKKISKFVSTFGVRYYIEGQELEPEPHQNLYQEPEHCVKQLQ
jgi:hypothetical protein